ncbi:MAG: TolC family protein [Magnetococcales bacterium]|nr:TolC family protein [Magnetococcales bacterium]
MTGSHSKTLHRASTWTLLFAGLMLTGCAVTPEALTLQEMDAQRKADLNTMFQAPEKIRHPLTLAEVVARALRYNLDHQVKVMEEAQAMDLSNLSQFDLLPKVAANAAYSGRSNVSASSSRSITTGTESLELSTSQDRNTADLGLTWNILDFGVSYYQARQQADRHLIARERERKVIQNLVQEARSAFWRAGAAQQLEPRVRAAVKLAESALVDAKRAETSELRSPLESLKYQKTLLENVRQLESILQEMATSQVELASMMTLPPGTAFTLAIPEGTLQPPTWNIPLEKMEESALLNQPDMREMAYQVRIILAESRKRLLKFFPGLSLNASQQYDSNSFAMNKSWFDTGVRITWNLMGLLSAGDQAAYNKSTEETVEMKRLALRMALLSQVHVAYRQFSLATVQFNRANELYLVEKEIAKHTNNQSSIEAQSVLERIGSETSAILAELRRFHALALTHNAHGKMLATTGQDPDVSPIQKGSLNELTERVERWLSNQNKPVSASTRPIVPPVTRLGTATDGPLPLPILAARTKRMTALDVTP